MQNLTLNLLIGHELRLDVSESHLLEGSKTLLSVERVSKWVRKQVWHLTSHPQCTRLKCFLFLRLLHWYWLKLQAGWVQVRWLLRTGNKLSWKYMCLSFLDLLLSCWVFFCPYAFKFVVNCWSHWPGVSKTNLSKLAIYLSLLFREIPYPVYPSSTVPLDI